MAETYLREDPEDVIVESGTFSGLSLVGLLLAILGAFSLIYVHFFPVAILAIVISMLVFWMAPKYQLDGLSKAIAGISIAIATTFAAWGYGNRMFQTSSDLPHAKAVAESLLSAIYKQEPERAMLLMGVPETRINAPEGGDPLEKVEQLKRSYRNDPIFHEIRNRKIEPKWQFVRLEGEFDYGPDYFYRLRYKDVAQTNPAEYFVMVHKNSIKEGPLTAAKKRGKKVLEPSD